jgi:hypothetical protein
MREKERILKDGEKQRLKIIGAVRKERERLPQIEKQIKND